MTIIVIILLYSQMKVHNEAQGNIMRTNVAEGRSAVSMEPV